MGYEKLGRKLGIGTRVAAKMLRQRAQKTPPAAGKPRDAKAPPRPAATSKPGVDRRIATRNATRGVMRGSRGFGRGFWKPFMHAAHGLWHEVTGVFFAIFAAFFAQNAWKTHGDWQAGPQHHRFIVYVICALLFVYFSISAFLHSRRSQR